MLLQAVKHLDKFNEEVVVLDDNSSFDMNPYLEYADFFRSDKKLGKRGYWLQWRTSFEIAQESEDDLYIFMPDDFERLDYDKIKQIHNNLKSRAYSCNIINDGREECFRRFEPIDLTIDGIDFKQIGFNDGGFFCNRATLEILKFRFDEISPARFVGDTAISSGIGQQLTTRMRNNGIFMLLPVKSLAYHGEHKSIMHPIERIKHPLISR
jgi:hypothetical protein